VGLEKEGESEPSQNTEETAFSNVKKIKVLLLHHSYTANLNGHSNHSSVPFK
jgi:hypothetical protein